MHSARARWALGISTAFTAVLLLGACQSIGDTARAVQPVGCVAALAYETSLKPDAPYRTRAAAAAARAAACTSP